MKVVTHWNDLLGVRNDTPSLGILNKDIDSLDQDWSHSSVKMGNGITSV